jgi:hypothetical protein
MQNGSAPAIMQKNLALLAPEFCYINELIYSFERGAIKIGTTENLDVRLSQFDDDKEQR